MSGKGSGRRPLKVGDDVFAANWERVFGKGSRPTVPADLPGRSTAASATGSNPDDLGSSPSAPATIRADGDYTVYCADGLHFWAKRADVRHAIKRSACTCPTYVDDESGKPVG